MATKFLTIKASPEEVENLELYSQRTSRTKTVVIREYLRSVKEQQQFWSACSHDSLNYDGNR